MLNAALSNLCIQGDFTLFLISIYVFLFVAPREAADLDGSWKPSTPHDEYWHPHVDKNNTAHYDYRSVANSQHTPVIKT